jgi:succinate dehydrogenase / fumarate reductase flavoprotein subunit
MNALVGIIRREGEVTEAIEALAAIEARVAKVASGASRRFDPGWNLALDLRNMLVVSRCVAMAALERTESRGGHTREDHPAMDAQWRKVNLVCSLPDGPASTRVELTRQPVPQIREDLLALFETEELAKYLTDEELTTS